MSASLAELTWCEAEASNGRLGLAIPLGATEQHGPHLPLSTDTDIACSISEGVARRCSHIVAAPPVAYGSSGEHAGFAGTLSIGQQAIELLIVELCRSASATFGFTLLVCAHGGNREPVLRAQHRLVHEGRTVRAFFPNWSSGEHAGRIETSLMLAARPESVHLDRARAGVTTPLNELLPALRARGVSEVSANGVLGDPAGASAEEGRRLLRLAIDDLARLAEDMRASAS